MSIKAAPSLYNTYLLSNDFALNKCVSLLFVFFFFFLNVQRTHNCNCLGDRRNMTSVTLIHTGWKGAKAVTRGSKTFTAALLESTKTVGCAAALKYRAILVLWERGIPSYAHL